MIGSWARLNALLVVCLLVACADGNQGGRDEGLGEAQQTLSPVTCPSGSSAEVCSGANTSNPAAASADPACFVALGDNRLLKEVAQTFTVSRPGIGGRARLVLKRLMDVPSGTNPTLVIALRPLVGGVIPTATTYDFATITYDTTELPLNVDTPLELNFTSGGTPSSPAPPFTMRPNDTDPAFKGGNFDLQPECNGVCTYAMVLRVQTPGIVAVGTACHGDDVFPNGRAFFRQMRKTGTTTFSSPAFTGEKRDLSFAVTLDDGCINGKLVACGGYSGPTDQNDTANAKNSCYVKVAQCTNGSFNTCVPNAPVAETCDGWDNNCDAQIDNGLPTIDCGVGACARTVYSCANGAPNTCVPGAPSAEQCNGIDDDCNGVIDQILGTGGLGQTTCGNGVCRRTMDNCKDGVPQTCTPDTSKTAPEVCDGLDNNCDGYTDNRDAQGNPLQQPYWTGTPANRSIGACRDGQQTCLSGAWQLTTNQVLPTAEICNNIDDDCDATRDNGLVVACYADTVGNAYPPATRNVGRCRDGTSTCGSGIWGSCQNAVGPTTESCNGVDDDCNGQIDDGLGQTTCGQGRCQVTIQNCNAGAGQICVPNSAAAQPEVCNGIDDDCDGYVDNVAFGNSAPLTQACWTGSVSQRNVGRCRDGSQTCTNGSYSGVACLGQVFAQSEVNNCNGVDDDCNGAVDDPAGSICAATTGVSATSCTAGACTITGCVAGRYNVDGSYSNGCECIDDSSATGSACPASPTSIGTLDGVSSSSASWTGKVPIGGTSDWLRVDFPLNPDFAQHGRGAPSIQFSSNPGGIFKFDVYSPACAGGFGGCPSPLTAYAFSDTCTAGDNNCSTREPASAAAVWPTSVYVRVYRTNPGNDCSSYTLSFTR